MYADRGHVVAVHRRRAAEHMRRVHWPSNRRDGGIGLAMNRSNCKIVLVRFQREEWETRILWGGRILGQAKGFETGERRLEVEIVGGRRRPKSKVVVPWWGSRKKAVGRWFAALSGPRI